MGRLPACSLVLKTPCLVIGVLDSPKTAYIWTFNQICKMSETWQTYLLERDEDSGSLHSAGSRVSFSEDVRVRPISSRGKGRPVGSSSPRTTARSALQESSKTTHSARTHCHDSPQASPRTVPRQGGERQAAYVEPRWVKELGGPSSTETGML